MACLSGRVGAIDAPGLLPSTVGRVGTVSLQKREPTIDASRQGACCLRVSTTCDCGVSHHKL